MIKRQAMWALVGLTATAAVTAMAEENASLLQRPVQLDVAAQPMIDALNEFASQAGVRVVFYTDVTAGVTSQPVTGSYTAEQGLKELLKQSGLRYTFKDERTVEIRGKDMREPTLGADGDSAATTNPVWKQLMLAQTSATSATQDVEDSNTTERLEEVIVTAQKREERLQDVPISITAVTGEQIANNHIKNIQDLAYFVPSFSAPQYSPGGRAVMVIRGLGTVRGNSPLTGVYLDETAISLTPVLAVNIAPIDLARVEVLKGPQGTLYGEGSVGGTVRYVTNKPDLAGFSGSADASLYTSEDSGLSGDLTAVINAPLIVDKLAIRVAAYYESVDGWIDRPDAGLSNVNNNELFHVRSKALFKPTENLNLEGTVIVSRNDAGAENIVNLEPRSESNLLTGIDPTARTGSGDDYELYNLTATYDAGPFSLLSSTAYVDVDKSNLGITSIAALPTATITLRDDNFNDANFFTQEFRIASNHSPVRWLVGGFYRDADLRLDSTNSTSLGTTPLVTGRLTTTISSVESWAGFGDLSVPLTSKLRVGGGLRYFDEKRTDQTTVAGAVQPQLRTPSDKLTTRFYVSYEPNANINLYASRAEGFRSGGANAANLVAVGAPAIVDPEELITYEIGLKAQAFGGKVRGEIALFWNDFNKVQFTGVLFSSNLTGTSYLDNSGRAKMKGIDYSLQFNPLRDLTLSVSGSVIDAKFTEINAIRTSHIVGDKIDWVPEYSLNLSANYDFSWVPRTPGFVRIAYNQQGPAYQALRTAGLIEPVGKSDTLHMMSASLGAQVGKFSVELFGKNILNEDGIASPSYAFFWPQLRPRTFGVQLGKKF